MPLLEFCAKQYGPSKPTKEQLIQLWSGARKSAQIAWPVLEPVYFDMGQLTKALEITWAKHIHMQCIISFEGGMYVLLMTSFGSIGHLYMVRRNSRNCCLNLKCLLFGVYNKSCLEKNLTKLYIHLNLLMRHFQQRISNSTESGAARSKNRTFSEWWRPLSFAWVLRQDFWRSIWQRKYQITEILSGCADWTAITANRV